MTINMDWVNLIMLSLLTLYFFGTVYRGYSFKTACAFIAVPLIVAICILWGIHSVIEHAREVATSYAGMPE